MMIVHAGEPSQTRVLRCVSLVNIPGLVGARYLSAALDYLFGGGPQALNPVVRDQFLQQQISVLEIELPLLLGKNLGLGRKYLLGRHACLRRPLTAAAVIY